MANYIFNINGASYTFSQLFESGVGSGTSDFYDNGVELLKQFESGFSYGTFLQNGLTNYLVNGTDISLQTNPIRTSSTSSSNYTPGAVAIPSWCSKIGFIIIGAGGGGSKGYKHQGINNFSSNGGDGGGGSSAIGIYNIPIGTSSFTYNLNTGSTSNIIFNDSVNTSVVVYTGGNGNINISTTLGTPSSVNVTGGSPGASPTLNDPNGYITNYYSYQGNTGTSGSRLYTPNGYKNAPSSVINNFPPIITQATGTGGSVLAGWGNKGGDVPNLTSSGGCTSNPSSSTNAFIQYWFLY